MSSSDYAENREWSDQFIPQIKAIVGPHLLEVSSFEVDTQQAADLVVMYGKNLTVACRIRRPGYYDLYPTEFTIRSENNGHKTELQKIVDGWGDLMFYGHSDERNKVIAWALIDLSAFRAHLIRDGMGRRRRIRTGHKSNGDGTKFAWFDWLSFPDKPPLIIASETPLALSPDIEATMNEIQHWQYIND